MYGVTLPVEVVARLDAAVALYGGGRPSSPPEVEEAVRGLEVRLDPDYTDFLGRYGGCFVGVPVYGLGNSAVLEATDVVALTRRFRDDGWPVACEGLVIGIDGVGNPFVLTDEGPVVTVDHDFGGRIVISESFAAFLDTNVA